jgi:hypothetical protein
MTAEQRPQMMKAKPSWYVEALGAVDEQGVLIKRSEARAPYPEHFDVMVGDNPAPLSVPATGVNISESGMCLVLRTRVNLFTIVRVRPSFGDDDQDWVSGRVIHCTQTVGGHKIGIQVE